MSNHLAVATVTELLKATVAASMQRAGLGDEVTAARPDSNGDGTPRVNVFLYRAVPNAAWRNADLPARRSDGTVVNRPQAALDLHYLLTFNGSTTDLMPERLLGVVTADLHAHPLITPEMVRGVVDAIAPGDTTEFLLDSDLDAHGEAIRLTPLPLDLEDLSKLWSTFGETQYALSVAYKASVVLIEADVTPQQPLPVRNWDILAIPWQQPVINEVEAAEGKGHSIVHGGSLAIRGDHLLGDAGGIVWIDDIENPASRPVATDAEITLAVPPELRAGIHTVRVSRKVNLGKPPSEHLGVESSVTPFALCPTIGLPAAPVTTGGALTVSFEPSVARDQRAFLLLNEYEAPTTRAPHAYRLEAPRANGIAEPETETDTIDFVLHDVEPATYLVRAEVDRAVSWLDFVKDKDSPDYGKYIDPLIEVEP